MIDTARKSKSLRGFACAMAASLCLLFHSVPSNAAAFQVAFDPPDLLWGIATFELSEPCLANNGLFSFGNGLLELLANGCTISLLGAHVSTDGQFGTYVDYVAQYYTPFPYVFPFELLISNNQFAGLTTLLPILLQEAGMANAQQLASVSTFGCVPYLAFTVSGDVEFGFCRDGVLQTLPGEVTSITRVPEPATLGLVFGAAFAGWLTRRRKRAA